MSKLAWSFIDRILTHANDICLLLNPSVNAYRRLDPHFEAPNQIKASPVDRGSMVRIPIGNEKSARVEVRSVAPDANPYLVMYSIFKTGLEGRDRQDQESAPGAALPARQHLHGDGGFRNAEWTTTLLGEDVKEPVRGPQAGVRPTAARAQLGTFVKAPEVQFHHEVYNQFLWNLF